MGLFDFKKKEAFLDLTKSNGAARVARPAQSASVPNVPVQSTPVQEEVVQQNPAKQGGVFNFFDSFNSSNTPEEAQVEAVDEDPQDFASPHEKRRKLAKRLGDMTNRIEDLSNQIYHLQQRVELLEKKNSSGY